MVKTGETIIYGEEEIIEELEVVSLVIHDEVTITLNPLEQISPGYKQDIRSVKLDLTNLKKAELELTVHNSHGFYTSYYIGKNKIWVDKFVGEKSVRMDVTAYIKTTKNYFIAELARTVPLIFTAWATFTAILYLYYPVGQVPETPYEPPEYEEYIPWWERLIELAPLIIIALIIIFALAYLPKPRRD